MFGQDLSRKKMYPTAMKVNPPGTEIVRSDLFICLETVSLSLVSAQEGCLTSLRCLPSLRSGRQLLCSVRQLPSFSTTAESETVSRQIKSVLTSVLSLGFTFLGSRNIYSPLEPTSSLWSVSYFPIRIVKIQFLPSDFL